MVDVDEYLRKLLGDLVSELEMLKTVSTIGTQVLELSSNPPTTTIECHVDDCIYNKGGRCTRIHITINKNGFCSKYTPNK